MREKLRVGQRLRYAYGGRPDATIREVDKLGVYVEYDVPWLHPGINRVATGQLLTPSEAALEWWRLG